MEKLIRNRFEQAVQDATDNSKDWLKDEFKAILESNKPYQTKCDHIGYSIASIDDKVSLLDDEIKQLQEYKKKLKTAKDIVLEVGAEVFSEYGISKIEGGGISSITRSKAMSATKIHITVVNEQALIDNGFYKKVIDVDKIQKSYVDGDYKEFIEANAETETVTTTRPSKLKINKRKSVNNTSFEIPDINFEEDAS